MNREQRIRTTLAGERSDRVPVGMWGHDWIREQSEDGLVEATLDMFTTGDLDFVKLNPRYTYFVEDWGATFSLSTGRPQPVDWPVKQAAEFRRLPALDPNRGVLAQQMRVLDRVRQQLPADVPLIQTMFAPLAIARDLIGKDETRLAQMMAESPDDLHEGLKRITEVFADYSRRCIEHGAAGMFIGTTRVATYLTMTREQYEEFGRPYDLQLIDALGGGWFSIFHVCQDRCMLDVVADYPVQAFSWAAHQPGNPSLAEGRAMTGKAVIGGVSTTLMLEGSANDVAGAVRQAIQETGGAGFMVGPSCTIDPAVPAANIQALVPAAESA
jgi:uroporphyrinogen decarboxylase